MVIRVSTVKQQPRRGVMAPLAAVLMVFLVGMVAFTVDVGWMVLAQTELQNVSDSAALSGAYPLMEQYVNYALATDAGTKTTILNNAMALARSKAKELANANKFAFRGNKAGEKKNYSLDDADIEFGYLDKNNNYQSYSQYSVYPNTIKVLVRRDTKANGSLGLFFGPALGTSSVDMNATASATIYGQNGTIDNFNKPGGMLPMTFDVNLWKNFLTTGKNADGNSTNDGNGVPTLKVYSTSKYKGNFGLLSLNDQHVGASDVRDWVDSGMSQADLDALKSSNLLPLSKHNQNKWDWNGENGFKSTVVQTINEHVGEVYVLPLFKPYNDGQSNPNNYQAGQGQGSNYNYNIVEFVPVKIVEPSSYNRDVVIQPVPYIVGDDIILDYTDPANPTSPAGTNTGQLITLFTYPKLTR